MPCVLGPLDQKKGGIPQIKIKIKVKFKPTKI